MGHIIDVMGTTDQGPLLNRVSLAQYTIAVVFVALRFFTRGCIVKKFGLDDLFIALAVVLGGAQTITIILQVENGRGRHSKDLHIDEFNRMLLYKMINMLVYFAANWAVKMSILALYYRIGSGKKGLPWSMRLHAVWVTAAVITAFSIATFLAQLSACTPVSRAWDAEHMAGSCINSALFMRATAAINVATDFVLLLFPLPLLPLLKFNTQQRAAIGLILSIGIVPVIASTMRLCEIVMSGTPITQGTSWRDADSSWTWAWVPVWSQIEVDIGIVASSLPSLNPLLLKAWSGFAATETLTMGHIPELHAYRKGYESGRTFDSSFDSEIDVMPRVMMMRAYADDKDVEIGLAITADARLSAMGKTWSVDYAKLQQMQRS